MFPEPSLTGYSIGRVETDVSIAAGYPRLAALSNDVAVIGLAESTVRLHTYNRGLFRPCVVVAERATRPRGEARSAVRGARPPARRRRDITAGADAVSSSVVGIAWSAESPMPETDGPSVRAVVRLRMLKPSLLGLQQ